MMAERPDGARPGSLPPAVRALRHAPARIFHPLRRRAAAARLALLRRALSRKDVGVASAGFMGPGRPAPPEAVAAAAHYGVDLSAHRSQLLTADHARGADLIVVMDPSQRREICDRFGRLERDVLVLGDLDPQLIDTRAIRDPVNQPRDVFEESYARIERCVRELERAIG